MIEPTNIPAFTINDEAVEQAIQKINTLLKQFREALLDWGTQFSRFAQKLIENVNRMQANDEMVVLRVATREYIRGGMLDSFALMNQRVQLILSGAMPETRYMTSKNRAEVAASAIRGFVEHHKDEGHISILPSHRWDETTRTAVYVS